MVLDGQDISELLTLIRERVGIDFAQYRENTLRRRISRRMLACKCADVASYNAVLRDCHEECERLLRDMTIKYTEFFRDPGMFDVLRETAIPALFERRRNGPLAIWSAGCATGEEAYSLAAMLLDTGMFRADFDEVKIFATDLDPSAVNAARSGAYIKDFIPQPVPEPVSRFFVDEGCRIVASEGIKSIVSFHKHDLTADDAADSLDSIWANLFDIVLCRNVLVYLNRPTQQKVLKLCIDRLAPGGFLVIGTKEVVPPALEHHLFVVDQKYRVFRKSLAGSGDKSDA